MPPSGRSQRAACLVVPNARCPVCGAKVYFYANEFGSRVFFDDLGPPWPKHPCTDRWWFGSRRALTAERIAASAAPLTSLMRADCVGTTSDEWLTNGAFAVERSEPMAGLGWVVVASQGRYGQFAFCVKAGDRAPRPGVVIFVRGSRIHFLTRRLEPVWADVRPLRRALVTADEMWSELEGRVAAGELRPRTSSIGMLTRLRAATAQLSARG